MKNIIKTKLCPILSAKIFAQAIEDVPVIIQLDDDTIKENKVLPLDRKLLDLPIINSYAGYMSTNDIYKIVNIESIKYISFDSKVFTLLDIAKPATDSYFPQKEGYLGEGITVAIVDTGVVKHSDLVKPENRIVGFKDLINNKKSPYDDNGHGTHVAGIIAGNGFSSKGKYAGIAPKSNILSIKALDENGGAPTSKIVEAISYIIETKDKYKTRIINLSVGTPANSPSSKDPLSQAVEKAVEAGLIVIVAAGNSGPREKTILSPGISPSVITVGAIDDKRTIDRTDDVIAPFSSRGPTMEGINKPDLLAPGVSINSLSNTNTKGYTALSGTSMATPLVSGAIALLLNKYPNLSPERVKKMLLNSCIDMEEPKDFQGAGVLNLELLFNKDIEDKDTSFRLKGKEDIEIFFTFLLILFLLDSRI